MATFTLPANMQIVKEWDGNELVTERGARVYVSAGRWQWLLIVDGDCVSTHDTRREAREKATRLGGK